MNSSRQALLLIGSPKKKSTSLSIGNYIASAFDCSGVASTIFSISRDIKSDKEAHRLLVECRKAGIILLISPLYVDTLPAPVIKAMENICRERRLKSSVNEVVFGSVLNCGFPESRHNFSAIQNCMLFAREADMKWAGGLAVGEGGVIGGEPLKRGQFVYRNLTKALDMFSEAVSHGTTVPEEALRLAGKPFIPAWLYLWVAERGWRKQAKKNGVLNKLADRPYE